MELPKSKELLSKTNMDLLSQILGNNKDIAKKAKNMSPQERNALLASLSQQTIGANTQNDGKLTTKNMADMTEDEKKTHREDLRRRLRGKQSMLKHARTPRAILESSLKNTVEKATEKLSEIKNLPDSSDSAASTSLESTVTNTSNPVNNEEFYKVNTADDELDDFLN
jgi:hypothetical protein